MFIFEYRFSISVKYSYVANCHSRLVLVCFKWHSVRHNFNTATFDWLIADHPVAVALSSRGAIAVCTTKWLSHCFLTYGSTKLVTNVDFSAEISTVPHRLVEFADDLNFYDLHFSFFKVSLPPSICFLTDVGDWFRYRARSLRLFAIRIAVSFIPLWLEERVEPPMLTSFL